MIMREVHYISYLIPELLKGMAMCRKIYMKN